MSRAGNFKPHEEGPLWSDESSTIADDAELFLAVTDEDSADEEAKQSRHDMARESLKLWLRETLAKIAEEDESPGGS